MQTTNMKIMNMQRKYSRLRLQLQPRRSQSVHENPPEPLSFRRRVKNKNSNHLVIISSFILLISIIAHQFGSVSSAITITNSPVAATATSSDSTSVGGGGNVNATLNESDAVLPSQSYSEEISIVNITTTTAENTSLISVITQKKNNSNLKDGRGAGRRRPAECTQEPRFSILTSESLLRSANVSYDEKKKEIWTFGRIYLVLECRASGPIDFSFDGHLINKLQSVETTRITYDDDPRMPSCYSIAITVETNRESTGNYSCWSIREPSVLSTSLYIFAHGGTPPYLLHADIGVEVIEVEPDIHDQIVTIPCVVTNPNISVALYKIDPEGFTRIPPSDFLDYDPKRGFLMQVRKYPEPYGKYKCIAEKSSYFDVIVHLKQPTDNFFHDPIVQGRLELFQDRLATQSFICNASSQNLNIVTTSDCKTPIDCRLARQCLRKTPYCSSRCRCSIRGDRCSQVLESNYEQIGFPMDFGCATIPTNRNGGVVQCSAVNFEPSAEVTYFIGLNGRIVQNWKGVPNDELVQVATMYEMRNTVMFVGSWVEFKCIASRFMFSRGFQWKFQLKNGTYIKAEAKALGSQVSEEDYFIAEEMKVRISHPDIASVLCYAPIWNETGWVLSSLSLIVKDSVAPRFMDPENSTIVFYVNERNNTISCEVEGFPAPEIMWFKDGEEYIEDLSFDRSVQNISRSSVFIEKFSLYDDGTVFICNATNPKASIIKTFTLRIKEESLKLTLTLAGVSFVILIGVFVIILWIFYTNSRRLKIGQYYAFTDQEVDDFFKGNPEAIKKCGDGITKAIYHPYDQTFEINPDDLLIDYQSPLGQGHFGVVLRGKLQTKQGAYSVAVKTTKDSDPNQLRTLLSEIKIMTYIGKHENIVNLLGAVTTALKKREVYVIVEFCQFGNLEEYLRNHRGTFFDEFAASAAAAAASISPSTGRVRMPYVRLECLVKTSDLIIWAYQITNALEYLSTKKIVHGDVALRNMLLDESQSVKLTDFGLSKHIYTQTNQYQTKKKDIPLPWRWQAPEVLKDHIFTLSSDVWSFGVLLYELFTLANEPYQGMEYNEEFLKKLGNGFRLNKPAYANGEIYATMRDCWRFDPIERPNFTTLKHFFLQFVRMQHPLNQSEIVQQMQYRHNRSSTEMDTESSDLDKEETNTFATISSLTTATAQPPTTFSTFGSLNSMTSIGHGQGLIRPKTIIA